jgi:predicted phage terminase large subunit-like protein
VPAVSLPRGVGRDQGEALVAGIVATIAAERERRRLAPAALPSALDWAKQHALIVTPGRGVEPFRPHPYQAALLEDDAPYRLVLKARQTGLSTTIALEALYYALHFPYDRTLLVSRNQELANLLIAYCKVAVAGLGDAPRIVSETQSKLIFSNGSEIVSLPANPATGRGYPASRVYLDEAAFMRDAELILQGIMPTLAPGGRLTVLSTPKGRANLFARLWAGLEGGAWSRHRIHWSDCPRYADDPTWEARTRDAMTEQAFGEEYDCNFRTSSGAVVWERAWAEPRYDPHDEAMGRSVIARSLSYDTASKDKEHNAYSVCVVGELLPDYRMRLRHVWRDRLLMPDLVERIEADGVTWDADGLLHEAIIEDRASGIGAYQTLMATGSDRLRTALRAFNPTSSKDERFGNAGVWVKNGSFILPQPCACGCTRWLHAFEAEVFEETEFEDQRDAVAQLILWKEPYLAQGFQLRRGVAA